MDDKTNISEDQLRQNLDAQLSELEMLQSMFDNPGEMKLEDPKAVKDMSDFRDNKTTEFPAYLDFTINLMIDNQKFELCVNLSHEYPETEPDLFVRNNKLNRTQHTKLNKDMMEYITSQSRGEACIYSAISWLQDNAEKYIQHEEEIVQKEVKSDELVRFWIYSHHIYSKTKRREILNLAQTLKLTGFCMPGKPGIICVEGSSSDCNDWWHTIKSMNWKRIFCKVTEECKCPETFTKFKTFEEVAFQSSGGRCNHMDIGELYEYLDQHQVSYIFKELFGVDGKK